MNTQRVLLDEARSTNTYLLDRIRAGELERAAVCARRQTEGRGRQGRRWESPEGGLYLSMSREAECGDPGPVMRSVAAGVAVAGVVREDYRVRAMLRWPNDLMVSGRKCAIQGIHHPRFALSTTHSAFPFCRLCPQNARATASGSASAPCNCCANIRRARKRRDLTALTVLPVVCAISSYDRSYQ